MDTEVAGFFEADPSELPAVEGDAAAHVSPTPEILISSKSTKVIFVARQDSTRANVPGIAGGRSVNTVEVSIAVDVERAGKLNQNIKLMDIVILARQERFSTLQDDDLQGLTLPNTMSVTIGIGIKTSLLMAGQLFKFIDGSECVPSSIRVPVDGLILRNTLLEHIGHLFTQLLLVMPTAITPMKASKDSLFTILGHSKSGAKRVLQKMGSNCPEQVSEALFVEVNIKAFLSDLPSLKSALASLASRKRTADHAAMQCPSAEAATPAFMRAGASMFDQNATQATAARPVLERAFVATEEPPITKRSAIKYTPAAEMLFEANLESWSTSRARRAQERTFLQVAQESESTKKELGSSMWTLQTVKHKFENTHKLSKKKAAPMVQGE